MKQTAPPTPLLHTRYPHPPHPPTPTPLTCIKLRVQRSGVKLQRVSVPFLRRVVRVRVVKHTVADVDGIPREVGGEVQRLAGGRGGQDGGRGQRQGARVLRAPRTLRGDCGHAQGHEGVDAGVVLDVVLLVGPRGRPAACQQAHGCRHVGGGHRHRKVQQPFPGPDGHLP